VRYKRKLGEVRDDAKDAVDDDPTGGVRSIGER